MALTAGHLAAILAILTTWPHTPPPLLSAVDAAFDEALESQAPRNEETDPAP